MISRATLSRMLAKIKLEQEKPVEVPVSDLVEDNSLEEKKPTLVMRDDISEMFWDSIDEAVENGYDRRNIIKAIEKKSKYKGCYWQLIN